MKRFFKQTHMRQFSNKIILGSISAFLFMGLLQSCQKDGRHTYSFSGDATIEYKVDSLLSLMTLEEKIGQLNQYAGDDDFTGLKIDNNVDSLLSLGLVGSILNVTNIDKMRKMQEANLQASRLQIPLIFAYDVVHGYKTIFPIPLASSCSWNMELIEDMAAISAKEAAAAGISWTFAPMVDIARDPRWGRVMEGAGEDTYLGIQIAKAQIIGYQGKSWKDLRRDDKIMACAKHFCAYGAAEAGRDYNPADISEQTLNNIYFPPFKACKEVGVATFMTAFNDLSGIPCTANQFLMKETLRNNWQFKGILVSDYQAIHELIAHGVAADTKEATLKAMKAEVDVDMTDGCYIENVKKLIEEGLLSEEEVNVSARRVLEMKFLLGLFDNPYKYLDDLKNEKKIGTPEAKEAALKLAQQSIVLLKNDQALFPIQKEQSRTVALIGPMVKDRINQAGEWIAQGDRDSCISMFEGFTEKYAQSKVKLTYAQGCYLDRTDKKLLDEAVRTARSADVVLLAVGENHNDVGEAASVTSIRLSAPQRELLRELKKLNKKIGMIVVNGRPLDLSYESETADAILNAWFLGTMSGKAIADVVAGDYNPSGKLVMSFPRNAGQIPIYYNHKSTGRPRPEDKEEVDYCSFYRDEVNTPLYPFGYGLSYTQFAISDLKADKNCFAGNDSITITCQLKNTGTFDGEEVVQLYVQDVTASITRPVKELKGFRKVSLQKSESQTVQFTIRKGDLAFYNINNEYIAEPGAFKVWIGTSSDDNRNQLTILLLDKT